MALPIGETPILTGKDAERFEEAINNVKKLSKEELDKIIEGYNLLKECEK
jgi:hypothetical protein